MSVSLVNQNARQVQTMNLLYAKSFSLTGTNMSIRNKVGSIANQTQQYQTYGDEMENTLINMEFISFTSLINTIIMAIDITKMFTIEDHFMVLNTSQQLYSMWPAPTTNRSYKPLKRPWYLGHVEYRSWSHRDIWMTPIYMFVNPAPVFGVSVTQTLLHNGSFMGVVGSDIDFSKMQTLLASTDNLMLVYDDGTLLFQNTYINVTMATSLYIYNESITGFTQLQWQQFKSQRSIIYTTNSVLKSDIAIKVQEMGTLPLYFLIFSNLRDYDHNSALSLDIIEQLQSTYLYEFGLVAIIEVFIILYTIYILQGKLSPMRRIIAQIHNFHKFSKKNTVICDKMSPNTLIQLENQLIKTIQRLNYHSRKKSRECVILEAFRLPKNQIITKIKIDFLEDGLSPRSVPGYQ